MSDTRLLTINMTITINLANHNNTFGNKLYINTGNDKNLVYKFLCFNYIFTSSRLVLNF